MILAAGRGERMRPLTDETPKPLLAAGGRPLIVHAILRLAAAGVRDIVVNHAHLGALVEATLGDGNRFGVAIAYSPEPEGALGTAGGIANALPLLGDSPFLVANGDVFMDFDFGPLARRDLGDDTCHLVLVPNPDHHRQGDFALAGDRLIEAEPRFTFAGAGLYRPEMFAGITRGSRAALAPLLGQAIAAGRASGELYAGRWIDVGTPERLAALDRSLRETA